MSLLGAACASFEERVLCPAPQVAALALTGWRHGGPVGRAVAAVAGIGALQQPPEGGRLLARGVPQLLRLPLLFRSDHLRTAQQPGFSGEVKQAELQTASVRYAATCIASLPAYNASS